MTSKLVSSLLATELLRLMRLSLPLALTLVFSSDMHPACRHWTACVLPSFPLLECVWWEVSIVYLQYSALAPRQVVRFDYLPPSNPPPPTPPLLPPSEELGTVWKWFIFEKIYIPLQVCPLELCHVITKVCNHVWLRSSHCFPCKMLCHAAHLMFYYLTKKKKKTQIKTWKTENVWVWLNFTSSLGFHLQTTPFFLQTIA